MTHYWAASHSVRGLFCRLSYFETYRRVIVCSTLPSLSTHSLTHTHTLHTLTPLSFSSPWETSHTVRLIAYIDYERGLTKCDIIHQQNMSKGSACRPGIQCKHMPGERVQRLLWPLKGSSVVSHVARRGGVEAGRGNLDACLTFPLNHNRDRVTITHTRFFAQAPLIATLWCNGLRTRL